LTVTVDLGYESLRIDIPPLEVARIVAYSRGFTDLDVEPMGDRTRITATVKDRKVSAYGETNDRAAMRLVEALLKNG
jgi:hypothetical protein